MKPRGINLTTNELLPPSLVGVMVLLDRSGSMSSIKGPMEQAFESFIVDQKAISPDGMWLTLHQFDSEGYEETYSRTPLDQVDHLTLQPRGGTPLRDALYRFGRDARAVIDDPTDPTERLLLVIVTDGGENQSRQYSWPQVRELFQGLEGGECETVWLGTSAALLEAHAELPAFAAPGASLSYAATNDGVKYAAGGLRAATMSARVGSSARSAVENYASGDAPDWGELLRKARKK